MQNEPILYYDLGNHETIRPELYDQLPPNIQERYVALTTGNKSKWTDGDIDAAFFMGFLNASQYKHDPSSTDPWPTLSALGKEIERLQALGIEAPSVAIRKLRYSIMEKKEETVSTEKNREGDYEQHS